MTAISLTVFFAVAGVALDLSRLAVVATGVQTAADAAAAAGAMALLVNDTKKENRDAVMEAVRVGRLNRVDGRQGPVRPADVEVGLYDFETGSFMAGGVPANAVRATPWMNIRNVLAALFGAPTTKVEKTATAAYGGMGSAAPIFPMVVGECKFDAYAGSGDCSDLPLLRNAPDPADNSAFSSLSASSANSDGVRQYMPTECGGGGAAPPTVDVGDSVNVINGTVASALQVIEQCFDLGIREFTIPIVACGSADKYSGAMEVTGFATIKVLGVVASGGEKRLDLESICRAQSGGGVGGGNYGTAAVALVN